MSNSAGTLRRLRRGRRGAVLAEFCIAIVPVLTTFFAFVQLSRMAAAKLVLKHGAIVGARAAAVIWNEHDNNPKAEGGQEAIDAAVNAAMAPWMAKGAFTGVSAKVTDTSSKEDPYGWVEVKVTANFVCNIPMGFAVCGGATKSLSDTYRMPHQGANYK